MAALTSELRSWVPSRHEVRPHLPARRSSRRDLHAGLLIAGVAAVGVGLVAWHFFGPDLRRYLKIHSM